MKRLQTNDILVKLQELDGRARPLPFCEGSQWLEVRCETCGPLAHGDSDDTVGADVMQREHANEHRGHRVNVELFFRAVVSTQINEIPKGDNPAFDNVPDSRD